MRKVIFFLLSVPVTDRTRCFSVSGDRRIDVRLESELAGFGEDRYTTIEVARPSTGDGISVDGRIVARQREELSVTEGILQVYPAVH